MPQNPILKEFCPKCGAVMVVTVLPNEKPFWRQLGIYPYEVKGDAFDRKTGEKLYRLEIDCPIKSKESFWGSAKSHYGRYLKEDLTKDQIKNYL